MGLAVLQLGAGCGVVITGTRTRIALYVEFRSHQSLIFPVSWKLWYTFPHVTAHFTV